MSIAVNPSVPTFAGFVQTNSDTYSKLTVNYSLGEWAVQNITGFDLDGLDRVYFKASGKLGVFTCSSELNFYPVAAEETKTKTTAGATHKYDWSKEYFVNWVKAEDVSATSLWHIRVSTNNIDWTTVAGPFSTSDTVSGEISVNALVRYVEIYPITGHVNNSKVTIRYSAQSWKTTCKTSFGGITWEKTLTIANGYSGFSMSLAGPRSDTLIIDATVKFDLVGSNCEFCFKEATATGTFSFACIEKVAAELKVVSTGFDYLSLKVDQIKTGLCWLDFSGTMKFTTLDKTLTMTPKLVLANDTCVKVYARLVTGASTTEITGLSIYGLGFEHTWNGITFESLSYLDGIHHVKNTYWERFTIKSTGGDTCCGGKFTVEVSTYFTDTHTTLFDWAETDLGLSLGVSEGITLSTGIVVDTTGCTKWSGGFKVTW